MTQFPDTVQPLPLVTTQAPDAGAGAGFGGEGEGPGQGEGEGPPPSMPVYNNKLGEPDFLSETLFLEARALSVCVTADFEIPWPKSSAAAPATCGQAMEVPLKVFEPVLLEWLADTMLEPGAQMSRQVP
mmetsp:Transcript_110450/g.235965  ORF Transcript_110450/g.235965 Transcript_110450/m.235965 type:complete len:129 (-) Transcript_110450:1210-1596(-)